MWHAVSGTQTEAREVVRGAEVRLVSASERPLWNSLMKRHHYLGFHSLIGQSLRYVAVYRDRWLALLGWGAAALKCKARDQWIGWTEPLKLQRLPLAANNCRFLILPDVKVPNLASRILSLNIKRLSDDWQAAHGHPIYLAETFVDPRFYRGTCYKAAGWLYLGNTRGFANHHGTYTHHGHIKSVFVRPLRPDATDILADPYVQPEIKPKVTSMKLSDNDADILHKALLTIPDCRMARGIRHNKLAILSIAICATLCGAGGFDAMAQWGEACSQKMRKRLRCRKNPKTGLYDAPSEPAIRRFLQAVDAQAVDEAVSRWVVSTTERGRVASVDGKTLRGARTPNGQVKLLSAFLPNQGAVVAQQEIPHTTNEIPVIKDLLAPLPLEGAVVTADAMHTQRDTATYVVEEKKADYVFTVKDNQPSLHEAIEDLNLVVFPPSAPRR
jgi:Druantia protein DruA/DDE_Tnp_1-associated/Transposase DDE domain